MKGDEAYGTSDTVEVDWKWIGSGLAADCNIREGGTKGGIEAPRKMGRGGGGYKCKLEVTCRVPSLVFKGKPYADKRAYPSEGIRRGEIEENDRMMLIVFTRARR